MRSRLLSFVKARQHSARMKAFYGSILSPGDLVFDIGANVGDRTDTFDRLGCRVVAVEPQAACVARLERRFGHRANVSVVRSAVGASEGTAEMFESDSDALSSLSPGWMERVQASGRFGGATWSRGRTVPLTTLDHLADVHGEPSFVKVDVEGYEAEVFRGLSRPVRHVSFEFTPEAIETAYECIVYLDHLGPYTYNVSYGESMAFELPQGVSSSRIREILDAVAADHQLFGDVYARRATS